MKKKEKKVLLIGGGRWAQIYLDELKKKKIIIYIMTKNGDLVEKISRTKNSEIKIVKNNINLKKDNKIYIILANKTGKRISFLKKYKFLKNKILIEKPLSNDPNDYFKNKLFNQNIYLSLQFYFSNYFLIIKKLIKNKKIKSIQLDWIDNQNDKKSFNKNIYFIEDAYYHFFSIIRIFLNDQNFIKKDSVIKRNKIISNIKGTKIVLNAEKKNLNKKRILKIRLENGSFYINFKKINEVTIKRDDTKIKKITSKIRNIPIQINNFLNNKKIIEKNSLKNLIFLFKDLKNIKNELSKT